MGPACGQARTDMVWPVWIRPWWDRAAGRVVAAAGSRSFGNRHPARFLQEKEGDSHIKPATQVS
ncbi:hypothetical protein GCM10011324_42190 [Allosediminivita pacifica]|nr:hypothetical protein GCM10011324_42190 [Allosediminivita pacifica]